MKRVKLMFMGMAVLALAFVGGCGTQPTAAPAPEPAKQEAPKPAEPAKQTDAAKPAAATYVGSQTCLGCHPNETKVADTKHNGSFIPLNKVQFSNPLTEITIKDGATKDNPKSTKVDLNKAIGIHMGSNIVVQVPKEAGFAKEYYRVAEVEKGSDGKYKWEAIKDNGSEDYSSCMVCHAPGLGKAGKPDLTVSCEACHGPGGEHATAPKEMKAKTINLPTSETCQQCHKPNPTADATTKAITPVNHYGDRNYTFSKHAGEHSINGCLTCHKAHSPNGKGLLLRADNPNDICMKCHADKKYDVEKVMFKNPVDAHDHKTADHSFGTIPLEAYKVDEAKKTMTITDQKALDAIKAKLPDLFK